jgi:hypothetical protein
VIKSHDVGTKQYIEWLILIDRVHPSLIVGVYGVSYREGMLAVGRSGAGAADSAFGVFGC